MMLSVVSSTKTTWQDLGFAELQKTLENTVVDLAANRERGEASRTALVQHTREFLKSATEDTKKGLSGLLRPYQLEIDASRKRCSFAEDAYISLYKKLIDLPDPCLALAQAETVQTEAGKLTELKCENRKLKETNDQLKSELATLRHHETEVTRLQRKLSDTMRNFDAQVKETSSQLLENHNKLLFEKEQELIALKTEMDEKSRSWEEKCSNLSKSLELAQSELFNLRMQVDKSEVGKSSELEILLEELEKSNGRIKDLETRLAAASQQSPETSPSVGEVSRLRTRIDDLEAELSHKDGELASLLSTVNSLREEKRTMQESLEKRIEQLSTDLSERTEELSQAQNRLNAQSNYSDICRELILLRSIEFPEDDEALTTRSDPDGDANGAMPVEHKATTEQSTLQQPLEALLLNKNRALQNQLAHLKTTNEQLQTELSRLQQLEVEAKQQSKEQSEVITLLESDVYRLQAMCDELQRSAPPSSQLGSPGVGRSVGLEGKMLAEAIGDGSTEPATTARIDPALLQIVEHQRDRFRARADQLEQAETTLRQQLLLVQRELEAVRSDNVKLYEKIRFLQTYSGSVRTPTISADPVQVGHRGAVHVNLSTDPLVQKYSEAYEARLDPFNQFSRRERERHYRDLRPHEKFMLKLCGLVTGDRRFRLGAFVYAIVLHLLVFIALYKVALSQKSVTEAETNCLQRYAEHMRAVHKEELLRL